MPAILFKKPANERAVTRSMCHQILHRVLEDAVPGMLSNLSTAIRQNLRAPRGFCPLARSAAVLRTYVLR